MDDIEPPDVPDVSLDETLRYAAGELASDIYCKGSLLVLPPVGYRAAGPVGARAGALAAAGLCSAHQVGSTYDTYQDFGDD